MGSLSVKQDHVAITVEWPYGALEAGDFVKTLKAVERIYKAVGDPQTILYADSLVYDPTETETP